MWRGRALIVRRREVMAVTKLKRLEGCAITKDIAVSKLSQLQKRILVHAYKAMLAKGQKIEEPTDVTICMRAPKWLADALTKSLTEIFKARKYFSLGEVRMYEIHPWMRFFEEVRFIEQNIRNAAREADVEKAVNLTKLYDLAAPPVMLWGIMAHDKMTYHAWPYHDWQGWYFAVDAKDMTPEQAMESMKNMVGEQKLKDIWIDNKKSYPVNCTIPELLRDLFDFKMQEGGYIDGLAFSPDEIGRSRYNSAQAALRRACSRLYARKLIATRAGQSQNTLFFNVYNRTGIGLTERGIAIAEKLLRTENKAASADLGIANPAHDADAF
jgi:hypothetical protein